MRIFLIPLVFLLLSGCAATGPSYKSMQTEIASASKDIVRLVFYRTKESAMLIARNAPIDINNKETGSCAYGGFFYRDVTEGQYSIKTELWDVIGECEIFLNAKSGTTYYFKVDPRSESAIAFMLGGAIGNAIESSDKDCGGAFKIYPMSEEIAKQEMIGLNLSE